jgi:hypothetical protein
MTQHKELFAALAASFAKEEVKTRPQGGRQLSYVTARTVMNRLDWVIGPENWWDDYVPTEHSVVCRLTIRLPDGQVVTKADAGGYAGMSDPGDDDKSGYSDAFKRAAVKFGVGRYLYRDGVPQYDGEAPPPAAEHHPEPARNGDGQNYGDPRSGKALFAWIKKQDDEHEYGLLKYMNAWGKRHEFPGRMVDWSGAQVVGAFAEAQRKIRAIHAMQQATEAHEGAASDSDEMHRRHPVVQPATQDDVDRWEREGQR